MRRYSGLCLLCVTSLAIAAGHGRAYQEAAEKPDVAAIPRLHKALSDPDPAVREKALDELGEIGAALDPGRKGGGAKPDAAQRAKILAVVPDMVKLVQDSGQPFAVRKAAVVAIKNVGPFEGGTTKVLKPLIKVVADRKNDYALRAVALWPVRFYTEAERDGDVLSTLNKILDTEKPTVANKDLRYDSAYLLSRYQRSKVSEKVLDTLLEFLKDDRLMNPAVVLPAGPGIKKGVDGRIIAMAAIGHIISEKNSAAWKRISKRKDIMDQMQRLLDDSGTDPPLQRSIQEVVDFLKA